MQGLAVLDFMFKEYVRLVCYSVKWLVESYIWYARSRTILQIVKAPTWLRMLEMPRDTKQKMYCALVRISPTKGYRSYCRRGSEKRFKEVLENKEHWWILHRLKMKCWWNK